MPDQKCLKCGKQGYIKSDGITGAVTTCCETPLSEIIDLMVNPEDVRRYIQPPHKNAESI